MSEYQYVQFRAIDRALTDAEMRYAQKQSSSADITRTSFFNEYNYAEFGGNVIGLLRRGFDVYLHFTSFGTRAVSLRLPAGLPFPKRLWSRYLTAESFTFEKDRKGKACILSLNPFIEEASYEQGWEPDEFLESLIEVRNRLVVGDLRALYVLWLCASTDEQYDWTDNTEPPVPGGLAECTDVFGPILELFDLDPHILNAAAEGAPEAPNRLLLEELCRDWAEQLSSADSTQLIHRFLTEDPSAIKSKTLASIRADSASDQWPTVSLRRSFKSLVDRTEELVIEIEAAQHKKQEAAAKRKAAKLQREREARKVMMAKDPHTALREATQLVDARGTANYKAAANLLSELREAVGGKKGTAMARKHAAHLIKNNPTLSQLKGSMRKHNLID